MSNTPAKPTSLTITVAKDGQLISQLISLAGRLRVFGAACIERPTAGATPAWVAFHGKEAA
jgi:hypothetical protein